MTMNPKPIAAPVSAGGDPDSGSAPDGSISDELFSRPQLLKVFVSSKMRGGTLDEERKAAVAAINKTGFATAWAWEWNALAGPYSSEVVCLGHARTSDGLVLIIADDLTSITRQEFLSARAAGAPCYIFLKEGQTRTKEVQEFIAEQRAAAVTRNFRNISELKTQITLSLRHYSVQATRREILRARLDGS